MAPFGDVLAQVPGWGILTFLLIGIGFGAVLEQSGFGDSRRLAAQFYFTDMRVLKVMFTAIVVAMLLIVLGSSLGLIDSHRLYINPTYLYPQIVGGLIMGIGFIIGGFCPGTSVVALATLKIDGLFFVAGTLFGVYLFGESVSIFPDFFNETYWGVFTLPDLFGMSKGATALMLVVMALLMFFAAEVAEKLIGAKGGKGALWSALKRPHIRLGGFLLLLVAVLAAFMGDPDLDQRWRWMADKEEGRISAGEIQIDAAELVDVMNDPLLYSIILDVREEDEYNLFHLRDARNIGVASLREPHAADWILAMPSNTVVVVVANGNTRALEAYRLLKAHGVLNPYILDGGINSWLNRFGIDPGIAQAVEEGEGKEGEGDALMFRFFRSVGSSVWPANPKEADHYESRPYQKKVKVVKKKAIKGGCD